MTPEQVLILQQVKTATDALAKVCRLAEGNPLVGMSEWFCNSYPFGSSLDDVVADMGDWVASMEREVTR